MTPLYRSWKTRSARDNQRVVSSTYTYTYICIYIYILVYEQAYLLELAQFVTVPTKFSHRPKSYVLVLFGCLWDFLGTVRA